MGGIGLSLIGTDADDDGNEASKLKATYTAGDINNSADWQRRWRWCNWSFNCLYNGRPKSYIHSWWCWYWSADIGYTAAGLSVNYHTGKDEWEANASYDLGGGATLKLL